MDVAPAPSLALEPTRRLRCSCSASQRPPTPRLDCLACPLQKRLEAVSVRFQPLGVPFLADRCYARRSSLVSIPFRGGLAPRPAEALGAIGFTSIGLSSPGAALGSRQVGFHFHRSARGRPFRMCKFYENFWASTERLRPPIKFPMRATAEFPRLERWWKKRPPTGSKRPCKCGCSDDAFKCYLTVQAKELMGEARRDDGTVMLVDREILGDEEGAA